MTRFVRLFSYDPIRDPGARLRLDYHPDFGNAVLADENTHPECVGDPDARHIETLESLQLTTAEVRWIATVTAELAEIMERNDVETQAEVDRIRAEREGGEARP